MNGEQGDEGRALVGTSGWQYDSWIGPFYSGQDHLLHSYAKTFSTVEINSTFYGLPERNTVEEWLGEVPSEDFVFSVKASRYLTHMKKLKDPGEPLERFFDAIEPMGDRAEVILFQLPPRWKRNAERLEAFLQALPANRRYTFEFRDASWFHHEIYELLREHNAAFCIYHLADRLSPKEVTADFVYVRLHGAQGKYHGSYTNEQLAGWTGAVSAWRRTGRDVYVYFDNDQEAAAPKDASRLQLMTGGDHA